MSQNVSNLSLRNYFPLHSNLYCLTFKNEYLIILLNRGSSSVKHLRMFDKVTQKAIGFQNYSCDPFAVSCQ